MAQPLPPPPPWKEDLAQTLQAYVSSPRADLLEEALQTIDGSDYLHWAEARHLPPPPDWSAERVWALVKFRRTARARPLDLLRDKSGSPFLLDSQSDAMAAALHRIDTKEILWKEMPPDRADSVVAYRLMAGIEEAHQSSAIEGAVTTRRRSAELIRSGGEPRTASERMVLNNFRTLERVAEWAEAPLTVARICEMQASITAGIEAEEEIGRIRSDDDVRIWDSESNDVVFVPPLADELPERLERLCAFANETDPGTFLHPVVRAILLHHQLAYDHPFGDGNGRTARALFMWGMLRSGYRWFRSLSISRAVFRTRSQYYRSFLYVQTDDRDCTYFVRHQLRCIEREILHLAGYLRGLVRREEWLAARRSVSAALNARQLALVDYLLDHPDEPYTVEKHRREHEVSQPTAWKDLQGLTAQDLLVESKQGRLSIYRPSRKLVKLASQCPPHTRSRNGG